MVTYADRSAHEGARALAELARALALDLERVSEEANAAAKRARERLTRLELELES